jgi:PAS domain S-box-containing protein
MRVLLEQALEASQKAEADLRARAERLQISLDAANVGTWDWNIRTGEVRWSDNLERIHGEAPGAFSGTFEGFLDGVHPDDRRRVLDAIQRALIAAGAYEVEYRSLLPDGAVRWFEGRGHVIRDEAGEPVWMSGICMDATERHRLQEQLRQTQRLEGLGVLAGGIAHDFNNLLVAIMGNASLALDSLPPSARAVPKLQDVLDACERAAQLTRLLLSYAGKSHPTITPTNLTSLVRELGAMLRTGIPKLIHIAHELEEELPAVLADEAQLQQVVMNLVINAAEAVPERMTGTVTISTSRRQLHKDDYRFAVIPIKETASEYVELSVRDTGAGMDLATQARIFEPFFTTKFTGRGLGLSAVLGIVSSHGGTILLQSAPGHGTCFTILLPTAVNAAMPDAPERSHPIGFGTGTILIVDDEPGVRDMARCALEGNGYRVLLAVDGLAAIQQVEAHPEIRAVLLDFAMPKMGGDLVASRIRALRPGLPIVLSSGYAESEAKQTSSETAYTAFLPKPYSARRLIEKLGAVLEVTHSEL